MSQNCIDLYIWANYDTVECWINACSVLVFNIGLDDSPHINLIQVKHEIPLVNNDFPGIAGSAHAGYGCTLLKSSFASEKMLLRSVFLGFLSGMCLMEGLMA